MKNIISIVSLLILFSCGHNGTTEGNLTIGDSNIRGNPESSIAKQLNSVSVNRWINTGIGGQDCEEIEPRFYSDIKKFKPKTVILTCGQNDVDDLEYEDSVKNSLTRMINYATEKGIKLYILNLNFEKQSLYDYERNLLNDWINQIDVEGVTIFDFHQFSLDNLDLYRDRIHLNDEGYKKLGDELNQLIKES